jgi:hypothetical protein
VPGVGVYIRVEDGIQRYNTNNTIILRESISRNIYYKTSLFVWLYGLTLN